MIPSEARAAAILLQRNVPANTRNSPTKLLVPGRPSEESEKITSSVAYCGIGFVSPTLSAI